MPMRTRTRPAPAPLEHWHQEGQRPDEVQGHALQRLPLAERLPHQLLKSPSLEIAQAAVDELEDFDEVPEAKSPLEEGDGDAAEGEVARDAGAGHAAPGSRTALNGVSSMPASRLWDHDVLTDRISPDRIVSRGRERGRGFGGRRAA